MEQFKSDKLIVGLTGGIGSGKSTVANKFDELGASVIDTDEIAHVLTQSNGIAMPAILAEFGKDYINSDGSLNRSLMRLLVFSDPQAKQCLESILHPLIWQIAKGRIKQAVGLYIILVVPLLVESKIYRERVNRVLVVDCDEQIQLTRVMTRGLSKEMAYSIITAQATRAERTKAADDIINNDGDLLSLMNQIQSFHTNYAEVACKSVIKSGK